MTTEDFIAEVEAHLAKNEVFDRQGNVVKTFKVLYGKIKVEGDLLELESVYPISKEMKVLFDTRRVCYPSNISTSAVPIHIAVNTEKYNEAEYNDFIKSLGHPTTYKNIGNRYVFTDPFD